MLFSGALHNCFLQGAVFSVGGFKSCVYFIKLLLHFRRNHEHVLFVFQSLEGILFGCDFQIQFVLALNFLFLNLVALSLIFPVFFRKLTVFFKFVFMQYRLYRSSVFLVFADELGLGCRIFRFDEAVAFA